MKKNKQTIIYILLAVFGLSTFSCKKNFDEINIDPIGKGKVEAHQLMASSLVNILEANMSRNRSFNNELMQVTVTLSDGDAQVFRYDFRRTWADYTWNTWYVNLTDINDIYTIASQPETENKSYQGISLILQAWTYQLLTDTYGDVPYSQANKGKEGIIEPAFDRQKDIYLDLLSKLEKANQLLKEEKAIVATSDPVYNGDISKWRRFGNSLYLRLLLRISGKAEVATTAIAKIKQMVDTNPAEYPVMENNNHTAKILWNGTNSTTAVYSSPFMVNVRPVDFRSVAICDFFINKLSNWNNPMIRPALGRNNVPRFAIAQGPSGYVGVPSGYAKGAGMTKEAYFYSDGQLISGTTYYPTLQTDPYTGIIMNCAEVSFIKAEAAARGWINGTAESYYYKGIADGINYWIPTYISSPSDANFTQYISGADLQWDNSLPLEDLTPGNNSQLEMIHLQKYFAMFLVDFQQWFEYRRTGHPILPQGGGLANGGKMPARMNYPIVTQSTNPTEYKNVVAIQGADDINTKVWWQKP